MRASLVAVTLPNLDRQEFEDVELDHHGRWLRILRGGVEVAAFDKRKLVAWSVVAPPTGSWSSV